LKTDELSKKGKLLIFDKERMHQIVNNLVSNAIKFSKSTIVVSLELSVVEDVMNVLIKVIDDGAGISKEDQDKLFQQFSQIKAKELQNLGGSGMGLWICRQLVTLFEGKISSFSEGNGKGATFQFEFKTAIATEEQIRTSKDKKKKSMVRSDEPHEERTTEARSEATRIIVSPLRSSYAPRIIFPLHSSLRSSSLLFAPHC